MKSLIASLDVIADDLQLRGFVSQAEQIDVVSNTLERIARVKARNRPSPVFQSTHPKVKDNKDHFPINDIAHARNALARANQYSSAPEWWDGSLQELKNAVARSVKAKFPSINVTRASVD